MTRVLIPMENKIIRKTSPHEIQHSEDINSILLSAYDQNNDLY